jgi:hypothetical protein
MSLVCLIKAVDTSKYRKMKGGMFRTFFTKISLFRLIHVADSSKSQKKKVDECRIFLMEFISNSLKKRRRAF